MEYYLTQIELALKNDLSILVLLGCFTAIDVIAALDSEEGYSSSARFQEWFKEYLPNYLVKGSTKSISSEDYHNFRCSLLHQLTGSRVGDTFDSIIIFPANSLVQAHRSFFKSDKREYFAIDLRIFTQDVLQAIRKCMALSKFYAKHKESLITFRPAGMPGIKSAVIGSLNSRP